MVWNDDFMKTKQQKSHFSSFTAWERWCHPPLTSAEHTGTRPAAPLGGRTEPLLATVTIMQVKQVMARCSVSGSIKPCKRGGGGGWVHADLWVFSEWQDWWLDTWPGSLLCIFHGERRHSSPHLVVSSPVSLGLLLLLLPSIAIVNQNFS